MNLDIEFIQHELNLMRTNLKEYLCRKGVDLRDHEQEAINRRIDQLDQAIQGLKNLKFMIGDGIVI